MSWKPDISCALRRVSSDASIFVTRLDAYTDYYFRAQIIHKAKHRFRYIADPAERRSWVALNMRWTRRGQLVFATYGIGKIGKPFNGSLICAPFLEFKDTDEEDNPKAAPVPVAEDGFVFFYNEDRD